MTPLTSGVFHWLNFINEHMYKIVLNSNNQLQDAVATIGNFDGLHLGHQQLLQKLNIIASANNYKRILITFESLPQEYFCDIKGELRRSRLSLLRDKYFILKEKNLVDELIIIHFNSNIAKMSYDIFIEQILKSQLNIKHVVVGHDFRFGNLGLGNINSFAKHGVSSTEFAEYCLDNERISSSMLRQLASENKLFELHQYLGRNLHYTSRVIRGNQLGRTLGVPTINLSLGRNKPALWGIYTAYVYIDNIKYKAVASIGRNPTICDNGGYKLEAHLLDIDLDLYGKIARVELLSFLRNELKFANIDELISQMQQDLINTRKYFKM